MSRLRKHKKPVSIAEPEHRPWRMTKQVGWSIFIGAIMVLSVIGAFVSDDSSSASLKYGKFKFTVENGAYATKIDGKKVLFSFFPDQVEDIVVPSEALQAISMTPQVIVTFKPEPDNSVIDLARFEISQALFGKGKYVIDGVAAGDARYALYFIDCKNATAYQPVIYLEQGNATGITYVDGCVILRGETQSDIIKLKDRLLYSIYGVI